MKRARPRTTPWVCLSLQFPYPRCLEFDDLAERIGVTRHRLLVMAVNAGLPAIITEAQAGLSADQQQTQG